MTDQQEAQIDLRPLVALIEQLEEAARDVEEPDEERLADFLNWLDQMKRDVMIRCRSEDPSFFENLRPRSTA